MQNPLSPSPAALRWLKGLPKHSLKGLKVAVTLFVLWFVFHRLRLEADLFQEMFLQLGWTAVGWTLLALLFMPLNWGLEARKWYTTLKPFYPDWAFGQAYRAVLAGLSMGIFTPNRVGEYGGRLLYLPQGHRWEAAIGMLWDRLAQMWVTLLVGALALEAVHHEFGFAWQETWAIPESTWFWLRLGSWAAVIGLFLGLFLARVWATPLEYLLPKKWVKNKISRALKTLKPHILSRLLSLGLLRYLVFSTQYYFLLLAFGYEGPVGMAYMMIGLLFLLKSWVPYIAFTELGIREGLAVWIFGAFGVTAFTAVAATFVLYLINLVLPALLGLRAIQQLKWR
ncbi:MAG: lysylphosphatidylglycerol synthase transmembrane domain-containing protein [Bacteroidota bacterium]